jgi:hypothetical protein
MLLPMEDKRENEEAYPNILFMRKKELLNEVKKE